MAPSVTRDGQLTTDTNYSCEIVSPICVYSDIETVQALVRLLRSAGARVNNSCGIHVHINAAPHTAQSLRNLANIFASREEMLVAALGIEESRTSQWCKKADKGFMTRLNDSKPANHDQLKTVWYNGGDESNVHYSSTRYRMLNLHAVFSKGTVEFRCFNSTTHAGEIKAYIQFCMAVIHQALTQRSVTYKPVVTDNAKYTFRCWLLRLGLSGDEFKTARTHLMKNLEGTAPGGMQADPPSTQPSLDALRPEGFFVYKKNCIKSLVYGYPFGCNQNTIGDECPAAQLPGG